MFLSQAIMLETIFFISQLSYNYDVLVLQL